MCDLNPDTIIEPIAHRKPNGDLMVDPTLAGDMLMELQSITVKRRGWRCKTKEILDLLGIHPDEAWVKTMAYGQCTVTKYREAVRRSTKLKRIRSKGR